MNFSEAVRKTKIEAVTSGAVKEINGKKITSKNGSWFLDGKKVKDVDNEVLCFVAVDDEYVRSMTK